MHRILSVKGGNGAAVESRFVAAASALVLAALLRLSGGQSRGCVVRALALLDIDGLRVFMAGSDCPEVAIALLLVAAGCFRARI